MTELSEKLRSLVEAAEPRLREISETESSQPILAGGWSRKQVIGHLIDSASNTTTNDSFEPLFKPLWISQVTTKPEACGCKRFKTLIGNS